MQMAPSDENENSCILPDSSCFQALPYSDILARLPKYYFRFGVFFFSLLSLSPGNIVEDQFLHSEDDGLPEVNTGNVTHCMTDIPLTWLELAIWAPLRPNWGGTLHKDSLFPSLNPLLWGQRRDLYLKLEKEVHQWGNHHLNDGAKQQYSTTASFHAQDTLQISSRLFSDTV